tara:strand:- start:356 stop:508 length:153 start_codon:yes stop_codon:yes gene_type:complete
VETAVIITRLEGRRGQPFMLQHLELQLQTILARLLLAEVAAAVGRVTLKV